MCLVLAVKDHELHSQKLLKDLPKEHCNFRHYLVHFSVFQILKVMNVGSWIFFEIHPILKVYFQYGYLFANIKYVEMVLIKEGEY